MIDPLEDCYGFSEELHAGVSGSGREVCFESIEPDETRSGACRRLAPKMSVSFSTLYGWVEKGNSDIDWPVSGFWLAGRLGSAARTM
jgi:hypothetical protein